MYLPRVESRLTPAKLFKEVTIPLIHRRIRPENRRKRPTQDFRTSKDAVTRGLRSSFLHVSNIATRVLQPVSLMNDMDAIYASPRDI